MITTGKTIVAFESCMHSVTEFLLTNSLSVELDFLSSLSRPQNFVLQASHALQSWHPGLALRCGSSINE